jgi:hypothetical protein
MQKTETNHFQMHVGSTACVLQEIRLEECVLKVQPLAEMLVRVLRDGAPALRIVVVDYVDDFVGEDDEDWGGAGDAEWELKSSVLFPFGGLGGKRFQLGEMVTAGGVGRRMALRMKLEETLEALSI